MTVVIESVLKATLNWLSQPTPNSLTMATTTLLFIGGESRPSSTNATFEVRNPLSNEVVGVVASASEEDCNAAIQSAAEAFKTWEFTLPAQRRDIFLRAADLVETDKYKDRITKTITQETGASASWASLNARLGSSIRAAASLADHLNGETLQSVIPGAKLETQRRAMGVVLAISPWNAPTILALRAIAIPIICGNTVVLKGSENSPAAQAILVDLFHEAGLPKGVFNYITTSREDTPKTTTLLIGHPSVKNVNFTGSDRVGRIIAVEAARHLKPCILELGGKAPVIVLEDADLKRAAGAIVYGALINSGQVCVSTERVIIQKSISENLIAAITNLCKELKAGDWENDPDIKLSALFTEGSAQSVISLVGEAVKDGAELILGDLQRQGAVVQPHLVTGIQPGMRLWSQESFGPVISITTAETIDEAVDLANDSDFTLTSGLWTENVYSIQHVTKKLRAGWININGATVHGETGAGFRGLGGGSGYGRFDIDAFTETRVVVLHPREREYSL